MTFPRPSAIASAAIRVYQHTLSPDHGWFKSLHPYGYCQFYPSCSEYGRVAMDRHGVIKGTFFTLFRVCRCHPWSKGGVDEVPE